MDEPYDDMRPVFHFENRLAVSLQAGPGYGSTSMQGFDVNDDMPLEDYDTVEVAILYTDHQDNISTLVPADLELPEEINQYWCLVPGSPIGYFIPLDVALNLVKTLKALDEIDVCMMVAVKKGLEE